MADLSKGSKKRKSLPDSAFGLPKERKYPLASGHAGNAKARAEQQYHVGNLSKQQEQKIIERANRWERSH